MSVRRMHHVGVVVEDLDAVTEFFEAVGLRASDRWQVQGPWVDGVVGLDGVRSENAVLTTPDGDHRVELSRFLHPADPRGPQRTAANRHGLRHLAFEVDDLDEVLAAVGALGYRPVREVVRYEDVYRMCFVRGPEGIIVELAEPLAEPPADPLE